MYNDALRLVNSLALQYWTCDTNPHEDAFNDTPNVSHSKEDAINLIKAMEGQEKSAFLRQSSFLAPTFGHQGPSSSRSECWEDPWFVEHFGHLFEDNLMVNLSLNKGQVLLGQRKDLLLRFPRRPSILKPLVDSKVIDFKAQVLRF